MVNDDGSTNSFDSWFNNNSSNSQVSNSEIAKALTSQTKLLEGISQNIEKLTNISQGEAQSRSRSSGNWQTVGREDKEQPFNRKKKINTKSFSDGIEEALLDALGASDFKKDVRAALKAFSDDIGIDLADIPHQLGKELTNQAISIFSNSDIGKPLTDSFNKWRDDALSSFKDTVIGQYAKNTGRSSEEIRSRVSEVRGSQTRESEKPGSSFSVGDAVATAAGIGDAVAAAADIAETVGTQKVADIAGKAATAAGKAAAGTKVAGGSLMAGANAVASGAFKLVPAVGQILTVLTLIEIGTSVFQKFVDDWFADLTASVEKTGESAKELSAGLKRASNRDINSREQMTKNANKRLTDDLESILRSEFDILKDSADKMIQVWEDNLKVINQTQGYSKAELQDLISEFATRIRSEGLASVVSAADFTENLGSVLQSGLSGTVAEEFAYLATKLNAAIPTQDFFQYSETYASLVGNAVKAGQSQSQAISYANEQLEMFASEVLYASRQLSGGLNVGLQNASDLFKQATEISIAAKTGDPSQIAGVLTSVSAITGAIAPDLASSIVDAVYQSATGGNSSQIVALRSLAGINASNTEFLQQFAKDPQSVFSTLFTNLANLQNMSESNYMEVAEGLSNVFGISKDSFARVDFNYLAQAVDSMSITTASLEENMAQLASGESTLSAEQMRIRQINEYMIEEGLSYVLDNEVARAIQQHMWEEQLANQMMENEYAVDIRGSFQELVANGINLLRNIVTTLIPSIGIPLKIANLAQTAIEGVSNNSKLLAIVSQGRVGAGNFEEFRNLTTRNKDLKLTNSYLEELVKNKAASSTSSGKYVWGTIGKSQYAALGTSSLGADVTWSNGNIYSTVSESETASAINLQKLQQNFDKMQSTMSQFFGTTVTDSIEAAIEKEQIRLASASITEEAILKRAQEYIKAEGSEYSSKLSVTQMGQKFSEEVSERLLESAKQRAKSDLLQEQQTASLEKATQSIMKQVAAGKFGESGYEAWKSTSSKYGISDLESVLTELSYSETDVKNYFESLEAQEAAKIQNQRNKDEETFWSESQRYFNLINANIHDVFDKGDIMGVVWPGLDAWLDDIDSQGSSYGIGFRADMFERLTTVNDTIFQFKVSMEEQWAGFRKDWSDYYIKHTTYTEHLTGTATGKELLATLDKVKEQKDKTSEDVINALTEAITSNPIGDLLDPTVQQNVFLAMILQGVQTIIQQNNTQGKLKLPDAISALATGMTVTDTSAANSAASVLST